MNRRSDDQTPAPSRLSRVERSAEGIPLVVGDGKYPHDPPRPATDLEVRLWDKLHEDPAQTAIYRDVFLSRMRQVARECGYALAVHGSEERDLDLVAAPWTAEAVSADQLVTRLCEAIPLHEQPANVYEDGRVGPNPEPKPWGRLAWSLAGCPTPWKYIDLSVCPRAGEAVPIIQWRER